jgi:shikimate dehydrogenase
MPLYGLIGYPLSHSFSKSYFTKKFSNEKLCHCRYENFPIEDIGGLKEIIHQNPELLGFNVTIPYKEKIIPFLDQITPEASYIGAVNTVKISRDQNTVILNGYNTDIFGFMESLKPFLKSNHRRALILGTGGASKAVKTAFEQLNIDYTFVSRRTSSNAISYEELTPDIISKNLIIVNTTPLGTYPNVDDFPPIPYQYITQGHLLYDLVYNPPVSTFLKKGLDQKAQTTNGLNMLYLQAEKAWEIWNFK